MVASAFSDLALEEVTGIIRPARRHAVVDQAELRRELEDLLSAVGTTNDGSDGNSFATPPTPDASHLDLVKQFQAIAASDDPLTRSGERAEAAGWRTKDAWDTIMRLRPRAGRQTTSAF